MCGGGLTLKRSVRAQECMAHTSDGLVPISRSGGLLLQPPVFAKAELSFLCLCSVTMLHNLEKECLKVNICVVSLAALPNKEFSDSCMPDSSEHLCNQLDAGCLWEVTGCVCLERAGIPTSCCDRTGIREAKSSLRAS